MERCVGVNLLSLQIFTTLIANCPSFIAVARLLRQDSASSTARTFSTYNIQDVFRSLVSCRLCLLFLPICPWGVQLYEIWQPSPPDPRLQIYVSGITG